MSNWRRKARRRRECAPVGLACAGADIPVAPFAVIPSAWRRMLRGPAGNRHARSARSVDRRAAVWNGLQVLQELADARLTGADRKSTRLNSSHLVISYAVFCLKKKK